MTNNVKINYTEIVDSIRAQFLTLFNEIEQGVANADAESLKLLQDLNGVEVEVEDEQVFIKRSSHNEDKVYIAVKFGSATTNFGSSVCNISLRALGTDNKIKAAQTLLATFVSRWNLAKLINDSQSTQIWTTPSVNANFNEIGTSFRSLFIVNGTLVIGQSTVRLGKLTYVYKVDGRSYSEEADFLTYQSNFTNSLSPQPFGNTEGFTKSETSFSSLGFTISTYLLDNQFVADCLAIQGFRRRKPGKHSSFKRPNEDFIIKLDFDNGFNNYPDSASIAYDDLHDDNGFFSTFKVSNVSISQKIADIPTISVSFTH